MGKFDPGFVAAERNADAAVTCGPALTAVSSPYRGTRNPAFTGATRPLRRDLIVREAGQRWSVEPGGGQVEDIVEVP